MNNVRQVYKKNDYLSNGSASAASFHHERQQESGTATYNFYFSSIVLVRNLVSVYNERIIVWKTEQEST
jgi:hypothetical protein